MDGVEEFAKKLLELAEEMKKKPNGKYFIKYLSIRNAVSLNLKGSAAFLRRRTDELFLEMMRTGQSVLHTKAGDLIFRKEC